MKTNKRPIPSVEEINQIIILMRSVFFPEYFGDKDVKTTLKIIDKKLREQVLRGYCFFCDKQKRDCKKCSANVKNVVNKFIKTFPDIKYMLSTDAVAAYEGDPAARSISETIFCYPSIQALTNHRIAHELNKLGVPLIPRIISEAAHSQTGIDIHPGAQIGERFFMDHGTGVVIGETTIIGKNVRLYQGVTLGAKSFPLDKDGHPIKSIARHPIVEDDVIIYSGATVLGRITIGKGSTVGGNVWLTESIPAKSIVMLDQQSGVSIKNKQ